MTPDHVPDPPGASNARSSCEATPDILGSETTQLEPMPNPAESVPDRAADASPLPTIPGYAILKELGRGGMGVVYQARHVGLNRTVALKMILSGELASPDQARQFRTEAEMIAQIRHPGIIEIFEISEHEGRLFFILEYCSGGNLESLMRGTPLAPSDAAHLLVALSDALAHAHLCGVVHRDLKPANILLHDQSPQAVKPQDTEAVPAVGNADPRAPAAGRPLGPQSNFIPKITDFGLARTIDEAGLARTNAFAGTPSYMSPEQASGKKVGPLSDVYSLGATLYECLTGRPPFRAASLLETLIQVKSDEPVPPRQLQRTIPRDLETICLKCLQKDPARRYASAGDLRDDLRRFLDGKPILARPTGPAEHAWRWCRRNPGVSGLLILVVVLVLSGMAAGAVALVVIDNARLRADKNAALEVVAREKAERAAEESRQRLIRLDVATGTRFLDANDRATALNWYLHAWRSDRPGSTDENDHRLRLASVLDAGPQLVGICFHDQPVQDAAVSPDGDRLLSYTVGGRDVYLWYPTVSRLAAAPLHHDGEIRHACYSPDGRLVGTAAGDGTACVWDAIDGKRIRRLDHRAGVAWLAFRPRTSQLLTVDDEGALQSWDLATGEAAGVLPRTASRVWYAAFSEDGRLLVTADRDNHARVWDASTGEAKTAPLPHLALSQEEAHFRYKRWPVFNAQGTLLLTASRQAVHLWSATTGEARWPAERRFDEILAPMHVAFSRRGDRIVVCNGYVARVLRVEDGKEVLGLTHPRQNQYAAFSDDDRHLVSVSSGGLVHVWDMATGQAVDLPLRCADFVRRVGFFPGGRWFFAASLDGTVRVWSLPTASDSLAPYAFEDGQANKVVLSSPPGYRTFSPDGSLVAEFGLKGVEVRHRTGNTKVLYRLPGETRWARFTADGLRLLTANALDVRSFEAFTGQPFGKPVPLDAGLDRRTFAVGTARIFPSADGKRLATLDDPRTVSVWDVETGQRILGPLRDFSRYPHLFGPPDSRGQVTHPRLTPDGQTLLFGVPSSGILAAWDVKSGQVLYEARKYSGNLHEIAISDDGLSFLAVSSNATARLYDTRTGAPLGPALVHTGTVLDGAVAMGGLRVATREGSTVRVWDARTGDLLARFPAMPGEVEALWFSRDGKRVNLGGKREALAWQLPRLELPAEQVPVLVRLLTCQDIQDANGLAQVDQQVFLKDPAPYRKAWLSWRGGEDDPQAQPRITEMP